MRSTLNTLRQIALQLRRAPAFSLAVVGTLALVVGPAVALLSLVEQIYWKSLPLPHPEQLVVFETPHGPFSGRSSEYSDFSTPLSYPEYQRFAEWKESPFSGVAARAPAPLAIEFEGRTDQVTGELVTGSYFETLGVRPTVGRLFTAEDDRVIGGHPVTVLSWGAWQRRFGGDAGVVGKTVTINGQPMTILGVAAREFQSFEIGFVPELWLPMTMKPVATPLDSGLDNPRNRWLNIVARLAPGVDRATAEAKANLIYRRSSAEIVKTIKGFDDKTRQRFVDRHLTLLAGARGRSDLRGRFGNALVLVLGLVGLLFALACANLASLFTARATRNERALTVRLAVGATRRDLVRQLLGEAGVLALVGAGVGVALAVTLPRQLPGLMPEILAGMAPAASPTILALAALVAFVATLGCGLLPAVTATRGELAERLRGTSASALGGHAHTRLRRILVGVQVAFSAAILLGAGLLVRSIARLADRDPGYRTENVLMFRVNPRLTGYSLEQEKAFGDRLEAALAEIPGVTAVGRSETPLLEDAVWMNSIEIVGRPERPDENISARVDILNPGYLLALDLPLRAGRGFADSDHDGTAKVALVNEAFVKKYLTEGGGVGARIKNGPSDELEVVGVVGNALSGNLRETEEPFVYQPFAQAHDGDATSFYLRTAGDPARLGADVRRVVAALDPQLPVINLRPLAEQARRSLELERQTATIASGLGATAALLAAIGLYGVLAYLVDARRRELALRSALGAAPRDLVRWVAGQAVSPVGIGLAVGLAAALAGGRLLAGLLFGVSPYDPISFAGVAIGVCGVAATASLVPARRALGVEPANALRQE
jgi:predicted permease